MASSRQFASAAASGGTRKAGQVGGAWASAAPAALAPSSAAAAFGHQQSQAQAQHQPQQRHSASTNAPLTLNEVLASPSFEVERRLVDELTAEGGMRAQPAADVVAKFGKHAQTLAAVALLLLLDAKMGAGASPVSQLVRRPHSFFDFTSFELGASCTALIFASQIVNFILSIFEWDSP